MVVDDTRNIVKTVKMVLELKNFDVVPAYGGKECLDKLEKEKPDLVLLDVLMPGMDGWGTFKRIKKVNKDQKVIFFTVVEAPPQVRNNIGGARGPIDYITKPFDNEDLVRRVRLALGE